MNRQLGILKLRVWRQINMAAHSIGSQHTEQQVLPVNEFEFIVFIHNSFRSIAEWCIFTSLSLQEVKYITQHS